MFSGWDNFFLMVGSAAGSLIGLLFVVATLNSGRDRDSAARGVGLYMTPIVFHLSVVLVSSAAALVPWRNGAIFGGCIVVAAAVGLIYCVHIGYGMRSAGAFQVPHWSDRWFYAVAPAFAYLELAAAGAFIAAHGGRGAPWMGCGLLAMLLLAIRNAWDLVTWLAPRGTK